MTGVIAAGVYLPGHCLDPDDVTGVIGSRPGFTSRRVAGYDEDTVTMAVEAARLALWGESAPTVDTVLFATSRPPYADKTNATIIHEALQLDPTAEAFDLVGGTRSAVTAMRTAVALADSGRRVALICSDMVYGPAGSPDESEGGDAAACLVIGPDGVGAHHLCGISRTVELLSRWRAPGEAFSQRWEDRFVEEVYRPLAVEAFSEALAAADLVRADVDLVLTYGGPARLIQAVTKALGATAPTEIASGVGNAGSAMAPLLLAYALARTEAAVIALVHVGDGVDVDIWRRDGALSPASADALTTDRVAHVVPYGRYASWRGLLEREPPRRPSPARTASPPSWRGRHWKYGLIAGRCPVCDAVNVPPGPVCARCRSHGTMTPERLANQSALVKSFTTDFLAYSQNPPIIAGTVDFAGGGRMQCELTDVSVADLTIGTPAVATFRRIFTSEGIHDYFWKVRPVR